MAKKTSKSEPISGAIRRAIEKSGMSRYEICKATGIDKAGMSRFMSGERGLTTASLDKLAPLLGLRIVVDPPKRS